MSATAPFRQNGPSLTSGIFLLCEQIQFGQPTWLYANDIESPSPTALHVLIQYSFHHRNCSTSKRNRKLFGLIAIDPLNLTQSRVEHALLQAIQPVSSELIFPPTKIGNWGGHNCINRVWIGEFLLVIWPFHIHRELGVGFLVI